MDGRHALVTSSGTNRLAVVDTAKLVDVLKRATPEERAKTLPNHLGVSTEFVSEYLKTGASPRGVVASADGKWAFVANSLDDTLSVYDVATMRAAGVIDLGGPKEVTVTRRGERAFHNADISFRKQFSCHSCHPDGHVDGITYDVEGSDIGVSPVDNARCAAFSIQRLQMGGYEPDAVAAVRAAPGGIFHAAVAVSRRRT